MNKRSAGAIVKAFFVYYVGLNLVLSIGMAFVMLFGIHPMVLSVGAGAVGVLVVFLTRKKIELVTVKTLGIINLILWAGFTIGMLIGKGNADGTALLFMAGLLFPFIPSYILMSLMVMTGGIYVMNMGIVLAETCAAYAALCLREKRLILWKQGAALILVAALATGGNTWMYSQRDEARYGGHGFEFMRGYSSTDFSDYMVYSENCQLATLDEPSYLTISGKDNMPIMDGAEACYPLYASVAKAVYEDIDVIEKELADLAAQDETAYRQRIFDNGEIVTFTNTVYATKRLAMGEIDLLFGAKPSEDQIREEREHGIELELTQIGKEAFVFFVEEDNPVTDLTSVQLRGIYHGDITNWNQVGGTDQPIMAFQRPAGSGSQNMMEVFMGETTLQQPKTYEKVSSMEGVIHYVAQYANEAGAVGYSFRYFVEELSQEKGVRLLSIDGVAPTLENIENGSYPLTVGLYMISRQNDPNPNVAKMIEFMLSDQGQELVRKSGYAPIS